jgi:hypothetical protein
MIDMTGDLPPLKDMVVTMARETGIMLECVGKQPGAAHGKRNKGDRAHRAYY